MTPYYTRDELTLYHGDCREVLAEKPDSCFDAVVTDPPYGLSKEPDIAEVMGHWLAGTAYSHVGGGFMGKTWDSFVPGPEYWRAVVRTLKPGGYALVFAGTRTVDMMAISLRFAGFRIRDTVIWLYGSGFPKGKGCLKPAWEPILLARRPGAKVLPLMIDECRVLTEENTARTQNEGPTWSGKFQGGRLVNGGHIAGRWPANVVHDGSDEVMEAFPEFGEKTNGRLRAEVQRGSFGRNGIYHTAKRDGPGREYAPDSGTAARFFYCAKASKSERGPGNNHPTVKPLSLMRWLVRLVTPAGGLVLDPFVGSGTTPLACLEEKFRCVGIDQQEEYLQIARDRCERAVEVKPDSAADAPVAAPSTERCEEQLPAARSLFDEYVAEEGTTEATAA